jgi:hypothetical protein
MKKYIYIGQENGKEVVIETSMEKPELPEFISSPSTFKEIEAAIIKYKNHIDAAPRIEVISPIPAYWKKGEEVKEGVFFKTYLCFKGEDGKWYKMGMDYSGRDYDGKEIANCIYPIDKSVEPKEEGCEHPNCDCADNFCKFWNKPKQEPEHIADTGKMIETEDELWEHVGLIFLSHEKSTEAIPFLKSQFHPPIRKTTPNE